MTEANGFHRAVAVQGSSAIGGEGVYQRVRGTTLVVAGHRVHVLPCISILSVVIILIGGAMAFQHLEQPAAKAEAAEYLKVKASLEASFAQMPDDHQVILQQYLKLTEKYLNTRATAPDSETVNWNFMGSLYFCVTVVTTIGYGTYTPITEGGKTFLLFYALIGIPSFVVFLTVMSDALLGTVRSTVKEMMFSSVEKGVFRRTPGVSISSVTIAVLAGFTTVFVLIWSFAFAIYNGWTYLDSVYFGVVTVTTIGFGDFAPDTGEVVWVEHLLYMLYFVFGLISMATLIAAIQRKVTEHQARVSRGRSNGGKVIPPPETPGTPAMPSPIPHSEVKMYPMTEVVIKDTAIARMASEFLSDMDSASDVDQTDRTPGASWSTDTPGLDTGMGAELVEPDLNLSDGTTKKKAKGRKSMSIAKKDKNAVDKSH